MARSNPIIPIFYSVDNNPDTHVNMAPNDFQQFAIDTHSAKAVSIHQKDATGCGVFYNFDVEKINAYAFTLDNPYVKIYTREPLPATLPVYQSDHSLIWNVVEGSDSTKFSLSLLLLRKLDPHIYGVYWLRQKKITMHIALGKARPPLDGLGVMLDLLPKAAKVDIVAAMHHLAVGAKPNDDGEGDDALFLASAGMEYPLNAEGPPMPKPAEAWNVPGVQSAVEKFCAGNVADGTVLEGAMFGWFMFALLLDKNIITRDINKKPAKRDVQNAINDWLISHGIANHLPSDYWQWYIYGCLPTQLKSFIKKIGQKEYLSVTKAYGSYSTVFALGRARVAPVNV